MFKKLPLALMMGAALSASNAFALGVGDIKVDSALNQRLDAEIELISSVEGELDDVTVSLASIQAFQRIKLDRPFHLTAIKFRVTTRADGTPIVKLTSTETIREPFLDFLVEVNWPKGRMLREYTVLLDPPVSIAAQPSAMPKAMPKPVAPAPTATDTMMTTSVSTDDLGFPVSSGTTSRPAYSGDTYGPVAAQQTLWNVASLVRSGDATIQQTMLALFDANPDAFIEGDIHHIKKGAVLRIPDYNLIVSRDRADAIAQVREINSSLDLTSDVETITERPGVPETMAASSPSEPKPAPSPEPELTIIAPDDAASSSASASSDAKALKRELALATESMTSQKMENEELKSRVTELEGTVSEMTDLKRLLQVQNKEMKELQDQLAASESAVQAAEAAQAEITEQVVDEPFTAPMTEAAPPAEIAMEEEAMPVEESEQPEPVVEVVEIDEPAQVTEVAEETAPAPGPLPPPAQKEPLDIVMDYIDKIKNNPTLLAIAGGVLVVLIAVIALVFRRKDKSESPDEFESAVEEEFSAEETADSKPSLFAGVKGKFSEAKEKIQDLNEKKEAGSADDDYELAGETELNDSPDASAEDATVFEASSDAGDFDDMMFEADDSQPEMAEVAPEEPEGPDPLEEVDVYEAFGDFEQAALIVKQAVDDFPDNNAYKLRLFKVYESGGMNAEFSEAAVKYKQAMMDSPEWGEVEQIGKAFAPDSPAFGGSAAVVSEAQPASDAGLDMAATMAMDVSAAAKVSEASEPDDSDQGIDFGDLDFELGDATDESSAEADTAAMEDEHTQALDDSANVAVAAGGGSDASPNSLEFDLGDMDFESAGEPAEAEDSESKAESTGSNSLEFDLGDLGSDLEAESESAAEEPELSGNEMEFDLGGLDFESSDESEPLAEATETVAVDSPADDMSMDFELDDLSEPAEQQAVPDTVEIGISPEQLEAMKHGGLGVPPDSEDPTVMLSDDKLDLSDEAADESLGVDLSDFSFDADESGGEDAQDLELSDSPDDEVSTKLDLARAYIDMGDSEGAKGILDEVIAEGNDAQKAEAQELLESA